MANVSQPPLAFPNLASDHFSAGVSETTISASTARQPDATYATAVYVRVTTTGTANHLATLKMGPTEAAVTDHTPDATRPGDSSNPILSLQAMVPAGWWYQVECSTAVTINALENTTA